ncbi:uncharacterized protein B0T15DRAFT_483013 [Chaetomium strumarium]|uniref:Uncharacterized protein n=1 Tax=Chaetomium strumarium TaxID=1170767 RepID=A0AAJ0GY74_9PEZI|nr:hypothetical protein B0T15DRAFT_483013 [Chaetomium strumarium]
MSPTIPPDIEKQLPGFLRLPSQLRQRIYHYLEVALFGGRPFTYYLDGRKETRRWKSEWDPPPASNFAGLLLSCRTLHAEVATLLYSANRFVIFYSQQQGLKPLRALTPASLAALTSLKVVLSESSCHHHTNSVQYPPPCCHHDSRVLYGEGLHGRPLLDSSLDSTSYKLSAQAILREWRETAACLSAHVRAGRLELSLEVAWSRQDRGYLIMRPCCRLEHERKCPVHNGCRLTQCSFDYDPDPNAPPSPGCFCRRRHAAASSSCRCWAPPTDLFLISRALCRDAQFVFFSGNRFVVFDFRAEVPWELPGVQCERDVTEKEYYEYRRFAASEFLRDVVPTRCLADLRFLELVFPPYAPHGWPRDDDAPVLDWRATADWIRGRVNAPALAIRFVMADFGQNNHYGGHRHALTESQGAGILDAYARLMGPLGQLAREDGLAGFYVELAYPWRWTAETKRQIRQHGYEWLVAQKQALEQSFCRRYGGCRDSVIRSRQKPEPGMSLWQRLYQS